MKKLTATLFVCLAVVATGCNIGARGADGAPGQPGKSAIVSSSDYEILKQDAYGGREEKSNEVINSQQKLESLCKELNITDIPKVDFKKRNVVALFMGQKSSGGFSIGIKDVVVKNEIATVLVNETKPQGGENVTMALTAPYCIAAIPKTEKVVFE